MSTREERLAHNESVFRAANEAIIKTPSDGSAVRTFICECGDESCTAPLYVPVAQYEAVRANPRRFLVLEGHEIGDAERVVERHGAWLVVEKHDDVSEVVEARDPRRG